MPSQLYLTSLIVQCTATLFLFLVFLVVHNHSRQCYLLYWTAAWFALGGGLLARLLHLIKMGGDGQWNLYSVYHVSVGLTALLALLAGWAFKRGRVSRWTWLLLPPVCLYFALSALHFPPGSALATVPRHLFLAVALWSSGSLFWQLARHEHKPGAGFLAVGFALWGLLHAHYATGLAPFGAYGRYSELVGFIDTGVLILVAFGMVVFALADDRSRLVESARMLEISEQQLKELAMRDPLTGLFNRRHFEHVAPQLAAQAQRMDFPIAVFVIDLNRFKETNDEHGHQRGDQILRAVAEFLRAETRAADLPFRWGGDEFLVLMMDLAPMNVEVKAAQLRERWEEARRQLESKITLALGWAYLEADGLEAAIRRADRRMYEDKRGRRGASLAPAG